MVQVDSRNVKGQVAWTPRARRRRQALPDPEGPHRHRPRQRGRHHARRLRRLAASTSRCCGTATRALVRDLGSTNGTQLNGAPVKEAVLEPDSVITIGRTRIVFRVLAQASAPDAGRAADPATRATTWAGSGGPANERTDPPGAALGFLCCSGSSSSRSSTRCAADLFGVKVRKLQPDAAAAAPARGAASPRRGARGGRSAPTAAVSQPAAPASGPGGETASTENATRLVITSGPKAGARAPARPRAAHDRPLQRVRPRHPRRLHLQPPRPPRAVGRAVDDPGPRLHERHLARRRPRDRCRRPIPLGATDQGRRDDVRAAEVAPWPRSSRARAPRSRTRARCAPTTRTPGTPARNLFARRRRHGRPRRR